MSICRAASSGVIGFIDRRERLKLAHTLLRAVLHSPLVPPGLLFQRAVGLVESIKHIPLGLLGAEHVPWFLRGDFDRVHPSLLPEHNTDFGEPFEIPRKSLQSWLGMVEEILG